MSRWGPEFTLSAEQLSALTNEALQRRGVELNDRLGAIHDETTAQRTKIMSRGKRLIKPAIRLTGSTAAGIGGILLSPITYSAALGLSVVGILFNAWDAVDFTRDTNTVVNLWQERRDMRKGAEESRMKWTS